MGVLGSIPVAKRIGSREILDSIGQGLHEQTGLRCECKVAEPFDCPRVCLLLDKKSSQELRCYGRAKAAPKTKSYALDADAKEDPGLVREGHGTGDTGESFEPAFGDALDPDIDGEVRLKAGDAPLKVHHPLTSSQRSQAMTFHRQKQTKFVRDMISVGLLPLTGMKKRCIELRPTSARVALR